MHSSDLEGMNRKDLLELAKERGVAGRSKMDKGALLAALSDTGPKRNAAASVNGASPKPKRAGSPDHSDPVDRSSSSSNGHPSPEQPVPPAPEDPSRAPSSGPQADRESGRFDNRHDRTANRAQDGRPRRGPHPGEKGQRPERDDDDRWNRAGGRDPNYGRFLEPGASPLHQSGRNRPGRGPHPQNRHDRDARADRARDQLRRTGEARRGVGYVPQFNRPSGPGTNPRDPRPGDRSRRGRPHDERRNDDRSRPQQNRARDGFDGRSSQRHDTGASRPQPASQHGEGRGRDRRHPRGGRNERKGPDRRFDARANAPALPPNAHPDRRAGQERPREEALLDRSAAQVQRPPEPVRPPDRPANRRRTEPFATLGKIGPLTPEELKKELERELAARDAAQSGARSNAARSDAFQASTRGSEPDSTAAPKESESPSGHPLELPEPTAPDHCRVLARDPYWIHAYWKISSSSLGRAKRELGDQTMRRILRVHSLPMELRRLATAQPPGFFDIEVGDETDNWYIHVGIPERTYRVDVGLIADNGLFYPLAVSNRVTTPPDKMSDQIDPQWKSTDQEAKELYELSGGSPVAQISHEPPAREHPAPGEHAAPRDRDATPRGVPESEASSSGAAETPAVGLRETDSISDELAFIADPVSVPSTGRGDPSPHPNDSSTHTPASAERRGRRSFGFVDAPGNRAEPASESWGASEARPAAPRENPGEFWFVLHTEVILSGATEPDAIVTIQGTPVRLQPDGTFSVRFQLPDGEQSIPLTAVSRDGSCTRWITPKITRETFRREYDRHSATEEGPHGEAGGSDVTE